MRFAGWILLGLVACTEQGALDDDTDDAVVETDVLDTDVVDTELPPDTDVVVPPLPEGPPNVLVLLMDDIGVDNVGAYGLGSALAPTPNLDALAAAGTRFQYAFAYPSCSPTRGALLTGRYGRRTGLGRTVESDEAAWRLPESEVGIGEVLRHAAEGPYTSAAFGKWHIASGEAEVVQAHPAALGFDRYGITVFNVADYTRWVDVRDDGIAERQGYLTSAVVDDALAFIDATPGPWFTWVAFHAGHTPWHRPPDDLLSRPLPALASDFRMFQAMVESMDHEIGRLLSSLSPEVRANTVVVALGDNGTHALMTRPPFDPYAAKLSLKEGGVRVPLIVQGPGIRAGANPEGLVHAVDLLPTIAELAEVNLEAVPDLGELDGHSLVGMLRGTEAKVRDVVYTESFGPNGPEFPHDREELAVRSQRYRYMIDLRGIDSFHDLQPQDFITDGPNLIRGGEAELTESEATELAALRTELQAWAVRFGLVIPAP